MFYIHYHAKKNDVIRFKLNSIISEAHLKLNINSKADGQTNLLGLINLISNCNNSMIPQIIIGHKRVFFTGIESRRDRG